MWEQLSINKPHLVYIILGGFTSIFMLVSLFIKEKLYIGEAEKLDVPQQAEVLVDGLKGPLFALLRQGKQTHLAIASRIVHRNKRNPVFRHGVHGEITDGGVPARFRFGI